MKQQQWFIASVLILSGGILRGQVQTSPIAPIMETAPPPSTPITRPMVDPNGPARISGGVMAGMLLTRQVPVYPQEAKDKHIGGTVVLHAIIGKDGKIEKLAVISGPEVFQQPSLDAIQQWTYRPYLLNGEP